MDKKEGSPTEKITGDLRTGKRVQMIPFFPCEKGAIRGFVWNQLLSKTVERALENLLS